MSRERAGTSLVSSIVAQERRAAPRSSLAKPMLACLLGPECREEVQTASNTSPNGLYFRTTSQHYRVGMPINVIADYTPGHNYSSPSFGRVVRIDQLKDGQLGIAVEVLMR